jgi:hypothetical protein
VSCNSSISVALLVIGQLSVMPLVFVHSNLATSDHEYEFHAFCVKHTRLADSIRKISSLFRRLLPRVLTGMVSAPCRLRADMLAK